LKEEEKHPERKQSVSVSIQPLTVNFGTSDLEIRAGQTLKLVIKVTGKSSPKQMTWYCNDQVIVASRKIKIDEQPKEGTITLTIPNVDQSNAGIYKMKAKNDAEEVSAEATVKILSKPSHPTELIASDITTTSVTLSWSTPGFDGGDRVIRYIVEKRAATRTVWQKVSTTTDESCTVDDLINGTKYFFRVLAENNQGQSEPVEVGPISLTDRQGLSFKIVIIVID
jgi:hypothetical protein